MPGSPAATRGRSDTAGRDPRACERAFARCVAHTCARAAPNRPRPTRPTRSPPSPLPQRDDLFAVCVSDGVTDVLTNEQVVAIAASRWPDAAAAARAVAAAAYDQGSSDNITALVITFGWNSAERGRRILAAAAADDADAAVRAVRGGTRGGPTGGLGGGDPRSAGSSAASGTQLSGVTVSSGSAFISPAELAVGANAVHAASWPLGALS